jgi:hypothetical protein
MRVVKGQRGSGLSGVVFGYIGPELNPPAGVQRAGNRRHVGPGDQQEERILASLFQESERFVGFRTWLREAGIRHPHTGNAGFVSRGFQLSRERRLIGRP